MAKKVSRKEEQEMKKLTPEERKAIKKAKKKEAYQKEKAERKAERYQSEPKKFYKRHKKTSIVLAVVLVAAIVGGLSYWLNTGFFREDSYKFISYDKYVKVGSYDKQTYKKSDLKVTDKEVTTEIDSRLQTAGKKKLDESFIKSSTNNKCKTKSEYEKYIRGKLEEQKKSSVGGQLLDEVNGDSKLKKTPSKQYKAAQKEVKSSYEQMASQYGMDLDSMIKAYGMDEKTFNKTVKSSAKESVKLKMVTHAIAKKEGISLSSSDYDKKLDEYKENVGLSESKFKKQTGSSYEEYAEENGFREYFLQEKVGEFLMEKATAK